MSFTGDDHGRKTLKRFDVSQMGKVNHGPLATGVLITPVSGPHVSQRVGRDDSARATL